MENVKGFTYNVRGADGVNSSQLCAKRSGVGLNGVGTVGLGANLTILTQRTILTILTILAVHTLRQRRHALQLHQDGVLLQVKGQ